jgi:hypothetical protein
MQQPTRSPNRLDQGGEEHIAVIVVREDPLLPIPSVNHMISGTNSI